MAYLLLSTLLQLSKARIPFLVLALSYKAYGAPSLIPFLKFKGHSYSICRFWAYDGAFASCFRAHVWLFIPCIIDAWNPIKVIISGRLLRQSVYKNLSDTVFPKSHGLGTHRCFDIDNSVIILYTIKLTIPFVFFVKIFFISYKLTSFCIESEWFLELLIFFPCLNMKYLVVIGPLKEEH